MPYEHRSRHRAHRGWPVMMRSRLLDSWQFATALGRVEMPSPAAHGPPPLRLLGQLADHRLGDRVGQAARAELAVCQHKALVVEVVDRQPDAPPGALGQGYLGREPGVAAD